MLSVLKERKDYFPVWTSPNLGLLTMAALVPSGWDVTYVSSFEDAVRLKDDFDIIAIGGVTHQAESMCKIAAKFRKKGAYVVIGGIHATVVPDEVKDYADTIIVGEAENTFVQFIADFSAGKPQPFYRQDSEVDVSQSPIPRYDLVHEHFQNYPVQTTRGCPHNCKFCCVSPIYGKNYRHKENDQVVEEIKFLKSVKSNPFVIFVDDNIFVNKPLSYQLMESIIPLDIKWHAMTDVSVGEDREFLKLLFRAGCKQLFLGFESMNPENIHDLQKSHWKAKKVRKYEEIVRNIQDNGIRVFGAFILGFDKDTEEDFQRIRDFVIKNGILGLFTILTPVPGTELYDEYQKAGRLIKERSWQYYTFTDCVIKHPRFTADELEKAVADLYRITYSKDNYAQVMSQLIKMYKRLAT